MINFTFSFVFALHLFCHTKDIYFIVCVCGRERERQRERDRQTEREKQKYLSLFPIFLSLCLPTISGPLSLSLSLRRPLHVTTFFKRSAAFEFIEKIDTHICAAFRHMDRGSSKAR